MSKALNRQAKFAELRALRQAGKSKFDTYQVDDVDDLYQEVDEDQYKKIVRDRLDQDDFVVDDNGEGYADDGREEWDREPQYETESENDLAADRPDRKTKKQRDQEKAKRETNDRDISEYFTKGAAKPKATSKVVKTAEDDQFLANLLGEVDSNVPAPLPRATARKRDRSTERRRARALSPPREVRQPKKPKVVDDRVSPPRTNEDDAFMADDDDDFMRSVEDGCLPSVDDDLATPADVPMSDADAAPSSPAAKVAERKTQARVETKGVKEQNADDEEDDLMEVVHAGTVNAGSVNMSAQRPVKKIVKAEAYPSPASSSPVKAAEVQVDASSWNDMTQKLNVVSSSPADVTRSGGKIDHKDAVEEDGSLLMFWTDYTEVNGSLCLFGKVLNKKSRRYVSCFVKVDNILRKLFFLPRAKRVRDGNETADEVEMMDVYNEVDTVMTKMQVGMYKIKPSTRKYAFELPDIPKEGRYLKLLYPYSKPAVEMGRTGETFSHVFGTNTGLFEQFVLWKNIMGPCWLKVEGAEFGSLQNASHCKLEVHVEHPNMVSAVSDNGGLEPPPLTLMSLAMRTTFKAKDNKQEVLAISGRVYENVSLSDTTPADKLACRSFTVMRPDGNAFPVGFEALAKARKKGVIRLVKQETELLAFFLAQVEASDADVLIGHQLEGVDYSILLNRLRERKAHQWSRLGRLRRSQWPSGMNKTGGNVFAERTVMAGRLLCDLANDMGKSVMSKCQSWSLTEMCSLYLGGGDSRRIEVDNEAALKTWGATKDGLMNYVSHMEADTYFMAALALGVQLLPLSKVLTNLAGNSWARTLTGTRAERNEYILLHEFHRNKYICPDKQPFKGRARAEDDDKGDEGEAGKKKDKYKGGLVFEPEKGLYDKFVLVMDFNSLYPSIMQEYNICFTTVDRKHLSDEEGVPDVPSQQDQGLLPKLIATLVGRRREVKKLMKDKTATAEQLATWDIKQLALKLTANSMYGCLGYTKSRFYARPLAVLVTFKGREILRSTKELAESKALQVIYGDTDSVMINANAETVADALKVGHDFKKAVNERYRLLEIDIDNVFRRILLQAKKKYAAISMVETAGKWVETMEVKGLDMKRREYCGLSKDMSSRILNDILSGDDTELSVQRVHEYLRDMAAKMRALQVPVQKYIIFTQLGKAPREYPNADSMPQVQVALRDLARGKTVRKGDVMSYIITTSSVDAASSTSTEPPAKRAYAPQDVLRPDSGLRPDVEWYLGKQIFPPVERLCANIQGTSTAQLAENLGLDYRRYVSSAASRQDSSADFDVHPLESQIPDSERFRNCTRLSLRCRACKKSAPFDGLLASTDPQTPSRVSAAGITCPDACCGAVMSTLSVVAQVEAAIRAQTARYYEAWLVCDDTACGLRTRQMSVYGRRCLGPQGLARGCAGRMRYVVGERDVYNQLVYFAGLFDVDKARARLVPAADQKQSHQIDPLPDRVDREKVMVLTEQNRARFGTVKGVVDKYLDKCGRQWVAMHTLFSKVASVPS